MTLADAGDVDWAIAAHEEALTRDPGLAQAHANLVSLYGRKRDWNQAEAHYRAAIALGLRPATDVSTTIMRSSSASRNCGRRRGGVSAGARAQPLHTPMRATTWARLSSAAAIFRRRSPSTCKAVESAAIVQGRAVQPWPRMLLAQRQTNDAVAISRSSSSRSTPRRHGMCLRCRRPGAGRERHAGVKLGHDARRLAARIRAGRSRRGDRRELGETEGDRGGSGGGVGDGGGREPLVWRLAWTRGRRPVVRRVAPRRPAWRFTHENGATGQDYMAEQMGAGVALFDYDNDGDLDVFLRAGRRARRRRPDKRGVRPGTSRLFRNDLHGRGGGGRRARVHRRHRAGGRRLARRYGMGVTVGDYDNDGDLDLFVTSFGPDTLFRNNGDGTFTDVTIGGRRRRSALEHERGLRRLRPRRRSRSLRGQLCRLHHRRPTRSATIRSARATTAVPAPTTRSRSVVPQRRHRPFADATDAAGIARPTARAWACATDDYNGDGWSICIVANDATPNHLWINRQDGTFVDEGLLVGNGAQRRGQSRGEHGHRVGRRRCRRRRRSVRHEHHRRDVRALYERRARRLRGRARGVGAGPADRRRHGVRHGLDRLRQRRLARPVRRQRRRQRRGRATRPAVPVSHEEPAVPQSRCAEVRETSAAAGAAFAVPRSAAARRSATWTTTATPTSS